MLLTLIATRMKRIWGLILITILSHIALLGQPADLYEPIARYHADRGALERKYTLKETQEYYERINKHYTYWLNVLKSIDYKGLPGDGKVDYVLFKNRLERDQFLHNLRTEDFKQVQHVTSFAEDLYAFIRARRRASPVTGAKEAALFHETEGKVRYALTQLSPQNAFSSWMEAELASNVVKDLRLNLTEAWKFYFGYHPEFTWWTESAYKSLEKALGDYEEALKNHYTSQLAKDDGSDIVGKPEGRKALIKRLQYEFIPYSPEELLAIGEKQFEWCTQEMIAASREMGFGNDWRAALEHVKDQYLPPGDLPATINKLAEEAIAFLEDNNLLTIPDMAKETWRMEMMSPEMQLINPFFLGGERISISYPTNTMPHEAKLMSLRGNNPHFCMATVHHELIAGHHLQGYMNQRYKPYRNQLGTPFWLEGWALYWEFLLYEKGLPKTPEDKMGFLFWRKHRAARIIFSLRYHLEEMTPQECIDFLVNEVGHEQANAEAEVRRSFTQRYDPLYQLAYMIGGIQFQALRAELVDSGKMTFRVFHDKIMQQNNIPVELLRAVLLEQDVKKNFKSTWRFAKGYNLE